MIGTLDHGLSIADAGRIYTLLTIGDGLVAQIPALLVVDGGRRHRDAHVARRDAERAGRDAARAASRAR